MFDEPIHYVVFTRPDNTWNMERIEKYITVLDEIEESAGPGVMVTIGAGPRHFSTGFDLAWWAENPKNMQDSIIRCSQMFARLLEFPMPTLVVFNGSAIAGGYIYGLTHDYRLMNSNMGSGICMSELKLGFALYSPYMLVCRSKLSPSVCAKMAMAVSVTTKEEALKDGLVDDFYTGVDELTAKIAAFAKRYAGNAVHRGPIKTNKYMQLTNTIDACRKFRWTPTGLASVK